MSNVFLIGIYVKRDSISKLISMFVACNQIFWIFCVKSEALMICILNFLIRDCSSWKREKSLGSIWALTIDLRRILSLCIFGIPYNLDGRGLVDFNVDLIFFFFFSIRKCFFSII